MRIPIFMEMTMAGATSTGRKLLLILAPFMLSACASNGDLSAVKAQSDAALAAANQGKSEAAAATSEAGESKAAAQQALATAQQALKMAQQAQTDANTATEEASRMYQRELRK